MYFAWFHTKWSKQTCGPMDSDISGYWGDGFVLLFVGCVDTATQCVKSPHNFTPCMVTNMYIYIYTYYIQLPFIIFQYGKVEQKGSWTDGFAENWRSKHKTTARIINVSRLSSVNILWTFADSRPFQVMLSVPWGSPKTSSNFQGELLVVMPMKLQPPKLKGSTRTHVVTPMPYQNPM